MPSLSHTWHIASNSGPTVSPSPSAWGAGTVALLLHFQNKSLQIEYFKIKSIFFSSAAFCFVFFGVGGTLAPVASLWIKVTMMAQWSLCTHQDLNEICPKPWDLKNKYKRTKTNKQKIITNHIDIKKQVSKCVQTNHQLNQLIKHASLCSLALA